MRCLRLSFAAVAALGLVSCSDSTTPSLLNDADITADVAASAGDAIASAVETLAGNQLAGALPYATSADPVGQSVNVTRSRTCFDAAGATISCSQLSAVRKIATSVVIDGDRSGTRTTDRGTTVSWTGVVHRVMADTLTRVFNTAEPPVETSRVHVGVSTGSDTTTFTDGTLSRKASEAFIDSVNAITFNLPRASNPWPVSGTIVRNASIDVTLTRGDETHTRSVARRVQVTFPADAQGNVVLQINTTTCSLNLVTHRVTNCQ